MTPGFYWARHQHGQAWLVVEIRGREQWLRAYVAGADSSFPLDQFVFQPFPLTPPNLNGALACANETCTNTFTPHRYGQKYCDPECQYLQSRRLGNRKRKERNNARKKALEEKAIRAAHAYNSRAFRHRSEKS